MSAEQVWCVVRISAGSSHSVAIVQRGEQQKLLSWGRGEDGQLGHGLAVDQHTPCIVEALENSQLKDAVCGAEYTLAVCKDEVFSWGWGDFGRLGHSDGVDVFLPRSIQPLAQYTVASVTCGDAHTLAILSNGRVLAFGKNQAGQLGNGCLNDSSSAVSVEGLGNEVIVGAACGAEHSVAVSEQGTVYAWGWNRYGCLGIGTTVDECLPLPMKGLDDVKAVKVSCGWRHSMVLDGDGQLFVCGWGKHGQLGLEDRETRTIPVKVTMPNCQPVCLVDGGWRHTIVATQDGSSHATFAMGWSKFGQTGVSRRDDLLVPTIIEELSSPAARVTLIACGWRHTHAVTADGTFYSFGRAANGALGFPSDRDVYTPTEVKPLSKGNIEVDSLRNGTQGTETMFGIPEADRYATVPGGDEAEASLKRPRLS